jgi:mono/diheme cytochrome c family protein
MLQLAAAVILAASVACAQTKGGTVASGNAEKGKALWVKDGCYSCHGFDGHGGAGPKLAPRPMAVASFIAIVRHPPASGMPTFAAKVIPDADLTDMWAYLRSIPDPPAVKDVPLLNQ